MCSTDPKQMVNDIPLGLNAAMVKVDLVIKHDAYLWRPSPEIFMMGDALNTNIAWPISKIQLLDIPAQKVPVKRTTPVLFLHLMFLYLFIVSSFYVVPMDF